MPSTPDAIFSDPRLAVIYDLAEGERDDLDHYEAIVDELGAGSVLDVGCGTGELACRLARRGLDVTGVDPAGASLDLARGKPDGDRVRWVLGTAADATGIEVDLAVMTGNVAQVFVTDEEWEVTLDAIASVVVAGGHLVFETRDPACRAWETWVPDRTRVTIEVPGAGSVDSWEELVAVALPRVTFRSHNLFAATGEDVISESTLVFRERADVEASLDTAGFEVVDVRDAPDRPGREWVFVARRR